MMTNGMKLLLAIENLLLLGASKWRNEFYVHVIFDNGFGSFKVLNIFFYLFKYIEFSYTIQIVAKIMTMKFGYDKTYF